MNGFKFLFNDLFRIHVWIFTTCNSDLNGWLFSSLSLNDVISTVQMTGVLATWSSSFAHQDAVIKTVISQWLSPMHSMYRRFRFTCKLNWKNCGQVIRNFEENLCFNAQWSQQTWKCTPCFLNQKFLNPRTFLEYQFPTHRHPISFLLVERNVKVDCLNAVMTRIIARKIVILKAFLHFARKGKWSYELSIRKVRRFFRSKP